MKTKYNKDTDEFNFHPEEFDSKATFYLHRDKLGFVIDIEMEDVEKLKEILIKNNIDFTVDSTNILPF